MYLVTKHQMQITIYRDILLHCQKGYIYKSPMYDTAVLKTLVSIFDHKRL